MPVVTRIAPSPTGPLHVGTARSALFNYLHAERHGGVFIVRIEDTDKTRSTKEYERDILEGLEWLGLPCDALYRQSERTDIYTKEIGKLLENDKAYLSKEMAKDGSGREVEVVRLRNKGETVTFEDQIRGTVSFDTTELGDLVIARSRTEPLYHLAVVIDDHDMEVTDVVRGEDHISNTSRQILIQRALGYSTPCYAHIPLILAPDRSKLSKRKNATSIAEFKKRGFLPEALINYLALLGWNPGTDQEFFTLQELALAFNLGQVQKGGAIFDEERLRFFNRAYIQNLPHEQVEGLVEKHIPQRIKEFPSYNVDTLRKAVPTIVERVSAFEDVSKLAEEREFDFFFTQPSYSADTLVWKEGTKEGTAAHLIILLELLESVETWTAEGIKSIVWPYAEQKGRGEVLWPLRFALTGRDKSPDPFSVAEAIGKEETLQRLHHAVEKLNQPS